MALPNPIVEGNVLQVPAIQSIDWRDDTAASAGWQIKRDGSASFNNANLLGTLGAGAVVADNVEVDSILSLPNYDDVGATLDTLTGAAADTKGQEIAWWDQTDAPLTGVTTEIKTIGLDVLFSPDRFYRIDGYSRITIQTATATGQMLIRGIANTDGSFPVTPTVANTAVMLQVTFVGDAGVALTPYGVAILDTTGWAQDTWVRMILTIARTTGTGTIAQAAGTANLGTPTAIRTVRYAPAARLIVTDCGPSDAMNFHAAGYNTTDTPPVSGGSTAPVPKTYTKTYYATWSRTYDGDNSTTWDDTPYGYQGYYSSTRGNTKSLFGFNYAQIASDLSGATLVSAYLTIKGAHAYYNNGFTCYWGTHNYTAKPSTWAAGNVNERRGSVAGLAAGESARINLGTSIENEFKLQTSRGIAIGPPASTSLTYYGYVYGATQSGKPYLTLTYKK